MSCRIETLGRGSFRYCPDRLPPMADRLRSLLRARFIDELTGQGLTRDLTVISFTEGLRARSSDGGICGLVGNPLRRFPGLLNNAVPLAMEVSAARYLPRPVGGDLGPFSTLLGHPADYPAHFSPLDLGTLALHRAPTRLLGRAVGVNTAPTGPLAGVRVDIPRLWHVFPRVDQDPDLLVEQGQIVALSPGLYADRPAAASLRARALTPAAGEQKRLLAHAGLGQRELDISDRVNLALAGGDLLAIEPDHPDLAEFIPTQQVLGATTDDQPAHVTLSHPLARAHREGVELVRVTPQAPAAANQLLRPGLGGDPTLFLDGALGLAPDAHFSVEISGGGPDPEYQQAALYSVLTDADGFYALPPLSRVARLELRASRADLPLPVVFDFSPDYDLFDNRLDFVFG